MKTNEAPEKIYIHVIYKPCEITFSEVKEKGVSNVEYTRTDAFIEKACDWLKEIFSEYENLTDYNPMSDFKSYMKGE